MGNVWRKLMILGVVAVLAVPMTSAAQSPADVNAFDISRFSDAIESYFHSFYVTETKSLQEVLGSGVIKPETQVLVTKTAEGSLALLTEQMAYHHVAQGVAGGKPWMATF